MREQIENHINAGEYGQALGLLRRLLDQEPTSRQANYVAGKLAALTLPRQDCRIAILRSFTVEPLLPLLKARCYLAGLNPIIHVEDFNVYVQKLIDPASSLYSFAPDVVLLAVRTQDLLPDLWEGGTADPARVMDDYHAWVSALRANSSAHLIITNLESPPYPAGGVYDAQGTGGQKYTLGAINLGLAELAASQHGVYVLDYDGLVARYGRLHWHDEYKWQTARMPISAGHLMPFVDEIMRFIHPITGKVCKALVIDMDNTLWGGVIGEDGMDGIKIGVEYPGTNHRALQRAILDLYERGVILAIASKNNEADALDALENHPGMLLRPQHFAAWRINWQDKAQSLREIAAELNIGVDALAFLDDSPAEREWVRANLPEVYIIDLPEDSAHYARILRECPVFERLKLSEEDRQRGRMYAEQRQRDQLAQQAGSLEDFYRSLNLDIEILPATSTTIPRIAQLTQKTNQFNLTTRRYSEQEIAAFAADPAYAVWAARVVDRFGDNGIVGVLILRRHAADLEIDTFLLSCRVIGRTVESALLAYAAQYAREEGARRLVGWFLPTAKNAPAREVYPQHQFVPLDSGDDGAALWGMELGGGALRMPDWIALRDPAIPRRRRICEG